MSPQNAQAVGCDLASAQTECAMIDLVNPILALMTIGFGLFGLDTGHFERCAQHSRRNRTCPSASGAGSTATSAVLSMAFWFTCICCMVPSPGQFRAGWRCLRGKARETLRQCSVNSPT